MEHGHTNTRHCSHAKVESARRLQAVLSALPGEGAALDTEFPAGVFLFNLSLPQHRAVLSSLLAAVKDSEVDIWQSGNLDGVTVSVDAAVAWVSNMPETGMFQVRQT